MKSLLNWIILVSLVMGALGASPLANSYSASAQAETPPEWESPQPLELPYVPAAPDGSALQMPADTGEVGNPPEQPPFSIQLQTVCDARSVAGPIDGAFRIERTLRTDRDSSAPNYGYGGPFGFWQQSREISASEEFADNFIGWAYNYWGENDAGEMRANWMNGFMPIVIDMVSTR